MLLMFLSLLLYSGSPCDHVPTELSQSQQSTCEEVRLRAAQRGIDPTLAVAVGYHETKFRPKVGAAGEIGPLQAMPKYWCPKEGECDPIDAGLDALTYYTGKHRSLRKALTRYNGAGPGAREYARKVTRIHKRIQKNTFSVDLKFVLN